MEVVITVEKPVNEFCSDFYIMATMENYHLPEFFIHGTLPSSSSHLYFLSSPLPSPLPLCFPLVSSRLLSSRLLPLASSRLLSSSVLPLLSPLLFFPFRFSLHQMGHLQHFQG
jgi:hypothetical protein